MLKDAKDVVRAAMIYGLGDFLPKAIGFFLIPVYTRYLDPEDYGVLSIAQSLGGILSILFVLGLNGAVGRFYWDYKDDREGLRDYLGSVTIFLYAVSLAMTLLALFGARPLCEAVIRDPTGTFFPRIYTIVVVSAFLNMAGTIPLVLFRMREEAGRYTVFRLVRFGITTLLILLFVVGYRMGALGSLLGQGIGAFLFFVAYSLLMLGEIRFTFRWRHVSASLRYGIPLIPYALMGWIVSFSDRLILQLFVDYREVGLYALGYNLGRILGIIINALNTAWVPFVFKLLSAGDGESRRKVERLSTMLVLFIAVLCAGAIALCQGALQVMATEKYFAAAKVIPVIVGAFLFRGFYIVFVNPIFFAKKTKYLPLITLVSAGTNIVLNFLLIPHFGMIGAAYATLMASMSRIPLTYLLQKRMMLVHFEIGAMIRLCIAFALFYVANVTFDLYPAGAGAAFLVKMGLLALFFVMIFLFRIVSPRSVLELLEMGRLVLRGRISALRKGGGNGDQG